MRGILAVDVDGVLIPEGMSHRERKHQRFHLSKRIREEQMRRVWLHRAHGPMLRGFAEHHDLELVWATYWGHEANTYIVSEIGLRDDLPVIEFSSGWAGYRSAWKYPEMLEYAAGRPLAWLDDEHHMRPTQRIQFLRERGETPTALIDVAPGTGLHIGHFAEIAAWKETW